MKHRRKTLIVLVAFISIVSGGWLFQDAEQRSVAEKRRLFQQILQFVAEYYVDSLDAGQLYDLAIDGMLEQLNDPYTSFLRREAFGELSISTSGRYGGVGLRIDLRDGWVTVVSPLADTPAERAGLEAGDQLVEIEGVSTRGWETQQAADVLRGEPGTQTSITVVRAGFADSLHFNLTRAEIHVNSIEGAMTLSPEVGYLRLTTVSEDAANELRGAITALRQKGATSLILDLRGNPGGILEQGVALADLFLDPNDVVVETRGRAQDASRTYRANLEELWPEMPLIVLVNGRTASAAEILAGALQDHDRAVILGSPTFGKGVAYLFVPLSRTEGITVTTSRWYTPSGRSIQRMVRDTGPAQLVAGVIPANDDVERDSTGAIYLTDGGRPIKNGGGGIQPDLVVQADTLTDAENRFAQALGSSIPTYRNVLTRYALELKGRNGVSDPRFKVTDTMLADILSMLKENGIEMADSVFYGGSQLVGDQFAYELTRYVFGREAEIRRSILEDLVVAKAVELLESAETPAALIARAGQLNSRNNN